MGMVLGKGVLLSSSPLLFGASLASWAALGLRRGRLLMPRPRQLHRSSSNNQQNIQPSSSSSSSSLLSSRLRSLVRGRTASSGAPPSTGVAGLLHLVLQRGSAFMMSLGPRSSRSYRSLAATAPCADRIPAPVYFGVTPPSTSSSTSSNSSNSSSSRVVDGEEEADINGGDGSRGQYRGEDPMDPPRVKYDDYFWMRDESRQDPKVLGLVAAENGFTERCTEHLRGLREDLYDHMRAYFKEDDKEVPYRRGEYMYFYRTQKNVPYKIHCRRRPATPVAPNTEAAAAVALEDVEEEVILDENILAEGLQFCDVHSVTPSPGTGNTLVYGVDFNGSEIYTLRFKDLTTGGLLPDELVGCSGDVVWGRDDSAVFYTTLNDLHRCHEAWMHIIGTPQSEDVLLFRDDDERFEVGVEKSASGDFLIIGSYSIETSEEIVVPLPRAGGAEAHREAARSRKALVRAREHGLRYEAEHHGKCLYAVTNADGAHNSKVCVIGEVEEASGSVTMYPEWVDVRPYNENMEITDVIPFRSHIVVLGRHNGLLAIWRAEAVSGASSRMSDVWIDVAFQDEVYNVYTQHNYEFDATSVRLRYSSPVTPPQVIEVDLATGARTVLKETEVPGYNKSLYACRRMFAPSSPNAAGETVQIPISLVFKRNESLFATSSASSSSGERQTSPVLMSGYGAYGVCKDPSFDFTMLPLLDRGVVYAIAHVRGGGEMGRHNWYEKGGKYLTKMNTFIDFADCAKYLISQGVTESNKLAIIGRSAGGLLIGAVINMYPSLFKAAVADVPFVDVLNTMSDPTIPLTVPEWEEWGNTNERAFHEYMQQYCPYSNVKAQAYPSLLVTAGLNDPRVQYWEPLKWVSKLRALKTDENPLLLKTDMESGHFSSSDRYRELREKSFEMAFVIDQIAAPNDHE